LPQNKNDVASTWQAFGECKHEVLASVFTKHADIMIRYNKFQVSMEAPPMTDLGDIRVDTPSIEKNILSRL